MTAILIIALVLFLVGLILICLPDGKLGKVGIALALIGLGIVVFLPLLPR